MLLELLNIFGGLILSAGIIVTIPVFGKNLKKVIEFLGSFQVLIGILVIILGFLNFKGIEGMIAIFVGIILLGSLLSKIPVFGNNLESFSKWLATFQVFIGIIAIIFGTIGLF